MKMNDEVRKIMDERFGHDNLIALRAVFAEWYDNGHTNEEDSNTCILKIELTDAVLFHHGTRYVLEF